MKILHNWAAKTEGGGQVFFQRRAKRTLLFFILTISFCELISRYAFHFYPGEVYQRYLIKKNHLGEIMKKVNGRGAVGKPYRGQPFKIAIFGNSTMEANDLNFSERISSQLEKALGDDIVHVESFAVAHSWLDSLLGSMKSLKRRGPYYDIILMGYFAEEGIPSIKHQYTNYFTLRWSFGEKIFHLWHFLKNFEERRRPSEKYSMLYKNTPRKIDQNKKMEEFIDQVSQGKQVHNKDFHLSSFVQERMIYEAPPKQHPHSEYIEKRIAEIAKIGKKIGKKIYLLELGYLWHPKRMPEYDELYIDVMPIQNFDKKSPHFHSLRSLSELFDFYSRSLIIPAKKHGIESLPFLQAVKERMPYESGLIKDGVHVLSKGATYASRLLAQELKVKIDEARLSHPFKKDDKRKGYGHGKGP